MVIIIGLGVILIGSILWTKKTDSDLSLVFVILSGTILCSSLIILPLIYYSTMGEIQAFNSVKSTIEFARNHGSESERIALQMKIVDSNSWLASIKYWDNTIFHCFIPDEVKTLKPLE